MRNLPNLKKIKKDNEDKNEVFLIDFQKFKKDLINYYNKYIETFI